MSQILEQAEKLLQALPKEQLGFFPTPNLTLLDRFLVMMEQQNVPTAICFNKRDLAGEDYTDHLRSVYENCGYRVFTVSAAKEQGMQEVEAYLKGKTTVVAGPSGVGKSSITNRMQKEIQMETGEISKKLKKGKTAQITVKEIKKHYPNKKIIAYIWPQYYDKKDSPYYKQFIPPHIWKQMLEATYTYCDGSIGVHIRL